MNISSLSPKEFADFLKKRREKLHALEDVERSKRSRPSLSFGNTIKRNMQRRRTK